jgi:CHC2 zinc finger
MVDELDFVDDGDFGVETLDFSRETARNLYRASFGSTNLLARWDRIRSEVRFEDVVEEAHGTSDLVISCPFHGRDSRPSFNIYRRSNDAYCYGCPEGDKYYDAVRFVAAKFGMTKKQAVDWIEKQYDLPPLEGSEEDEDEEDDEDGKVTRSIDFTDLADPYIAHAAAAFLADPDPDLAREYIEIFFDSVPERDADPASEDELKKCMPLARVLGSEALEEIKKKRFAA